jgi:mRNA-degrading endonuclease RelE of RelBE toxin-antitoxin system
VPDFSIQLTRPAISDLEGMPERLRGGILEGISGLKEAPFPDGYARKKLKGFSFPVYRLRVGNHRILYRIDQTIVTILRVIDRKELEKTIRRIRPFSA